MGLSVLQFLVIIITLRTRTIKSSIWWQWFNSVFSADPFFEIPNAYMLTCPSLKKSLTEVPHSVCVRHALDQYLEARYMYLLAKLRLSLQLAVLLWQNSSFNRTLPGGSTSALVRQNIVEVLHLYAGLENGLEWWNGVCNGLWNLHFS